jgi:hypothetical protein
MTLGPLTGFVEQLGLLQAATAGSATAVVPVDVQPGIGPGGDGAGEDE